MNIIIHSKTHGDFLSSHKNVLFLLALAFICSACATSYKNISPTTLNYVEQPVNEDGLTFAYQTDVMRWRKNKKIVKKERKQDLNVIAVKLTNNTGRDIVFSEDIELVSALNIIQPVPKKEIITKLKQHPPAYLFYLLLTPLNLYTYNENTGASSGPVPIGKILGPGLTAINMGISATANSSFKKEMNDFDIYDRVIKDGETVYGILGLPFRNVGKLSIRLKE